MKNKSIIFHARSRVLANIAAEIYFNAEHNKLERKNEVNKQINTFNYWGYDLFDRNIFSLAYGKNKELYLRAFNNLGRIFKLNIEFVDIDRNYYEYSQKYNKNFFRMITLYCPEKLQKYFWRQIHNDLNFLIKSKQEDNV